MAIDVEEYQNLKKKAADIRSDIDRAEGTLSSLMTQMKNEFGCSSLEEAQEKLGLLRVDLTEAEAAYESALTKFKEDFNDLL